MNIIHHTTSPDLKINRYECSSFGRLSRLKVKYSNYDCDKIKENILKFAEEVKDNEIIKSVLMKTFEVTLLVDTVCLLWKEIENGTCCEEDNEDNIKRHIINRLEDFERGYNLETNASSAIDISDAPDVPSCPNGQSVKFIVEVTPLLKMFENEPFTGVSSSKISENVLLQARYLRKKKYLNTAIGMV